MTVLQSGAASSPAITADAAAVLSVGIAAFTTGYAERDIGSAATGAAAEDDDLFVNGLVSTTPLETSVTLTLAVVFVA